MSVGVIIVAGGRGARVGAAAPKQLLDLGGRSMLQRSIAAFDAHPAVTTLVVVLPAELVGQAAELVGPTARPCVFAAGGPRRQDSVRRGLAAMPAGPTVILVHDAARPFVTREVIDRVIDAAGADGAAVPAVAVRETVKRVDAAGHHVRETIPRDEIWLAQTPQGFARDVLARAYAAAGDGGREATDDAALVERAGHPVRVVTGDPANMKITTTDDVAAARARFDGGSVRVGTGYDLHRLVPNRTLVVAGLVIDRERGPHSHSDGDVLCHALTDAILGAAAAGDIGQHFPNTDARWTDAPGLDLLGRAASIVVERGFRVAAVDATIVLERPKLLPHVPAIREALARVLAVPLEAVSVKAKTNEGVDAVGRGEAIAAHAVATLAPGSAS